MYYNTYAIMKKTIFYSWQSDLPSDINRNFIELSLGKAIEKLNGIYHIDSSPRNDLYELDKDTKDTPGSPSIPDTILKKITDCSVFVADLTFVARTKKNPETGIIKPVPNPNVLIEYGYATRAIGESNILAVMNTEYGVPTKESIPFNIVHKRWPIQYKLSDGNGPEKEKEMEALVEKLYENIRTVVEDGEYVSGTLEATIVNHDSRYYFRYKKKYILVILGLKIENRDEKEVSVSMDKLEINVSSNWFEAKKSNMRGGHIEHDGGTFSINPDEILGVDKDARIAAFGSDTIKVVYEMRIREYESYFQNKEPINVRGNVKSLDGREASFSGDINY